MQLGELFQRLDAATASPNKVLLQMAGDRHVHMDVKDELRELRKDLAFLAADGQTAKLSFETVLRLCTETGAGRSSDGVFAKLEAEAEAVAALIRDAIPNLVLVTDWDGTMKDYGSNYTTCIQPAYSAVVLCRFAAACTRFAAVLTAGPLRQPGILDLTAVPVASGFLAFGGCWGREWLVAGHRYVQDSHISTEARASLEAFAQRMTAVLADRFPVFRYIGSGFQYKVPSLPSSVGHGEEKC